MEGVGRNGSPMSLQGVTINVVVIVDTVAVIALRVVDIVVFSTRLPLPSLLSQQVSLPHSLHTRVTALSNNRYSPPPPVLVQPSLLPHPHHLPFSIPSASPASLPSLQNGVTPQGLRVMGDIRGGMEVARAAKVGGVIRVVWGVR